MPAKKMSRVREAPLTMRILKAVRVALDKAAQVESRNRSAQAEHILQGWLREKGYLDARQ